MVEAGTAGVTAAQLRTLNRFLALFLAAGGGDAIVQFTVGTTYDWRHLLGALVAAFVLAGEKWLSEQSSQTASPTVAAVNATLQTALNSPTVAVPPPKDPTPPAGIIYTPP